MVPKKEERPPLLAGIHTLEILSPVYSPIEPEDKPYLVREMGIRPPKKNGKRDFTLYSYALNPNKALGQPVIRTYSDFQEASEYVLGDMEIPEYLRKSRVDFCFDSLDDDYERYRKLNRCLILLISLQYRVGNRYETFDPLTLENKTVCIKGSHIQMENYNKGIEDPYCGIKNRLELRSTSLAKDIPIPLIFEGWNKRLYTAVAQYDLLQERTNIGLLAKWEQERSTLTSGNEFVRKYSGYIYTRKQLVELYTLMGMKNPEQVAKNFIQRNEIEFIRPQDLSGYVDSILESANTFFGT